MIFKEIECAGCGTLIKSVTRTLCKKCYQQQWRQDNEEYPKLYYIDNKEKEAIRKKVYRQENTEYLREYQRTYSKLRYDSDFVFKMSRVLRSRLNTAIKEETKVGSAIDDLGCSIAKFKIHIQLKFYRNPSNKHEYMTWDNWAKDGWHIDHIKPLSSFDLTDPEQLKKACHYTNLRPLWAKENLKKGNKYEE